MIIYIEDFISNKQEVIDKAVEEAILFIDCKEYLNDEGYYLDLFVTSKDTEKELSAIDYLNNSFAVYKAIYKQIPEFLIFLRPHIFKEVLVDYQLFAKAIDYEILDFSVKRAIDRGVDGVWLTNRLLDYEKMLTFSTANYTIK